MLNERKLTKPELAKREDIVMDMKKNKRKLVKRYGKDAEKVMYGRATNMAKKQNENMDDKKLNLRKMIEDALQNPKAADLNKDGKLSDYEEKRGTAIEKNLKESDPSIPLEKDFTYDYEDIGQFYLEGFNNPPSLTQDELGILGKKIVNQLYKGDIGAAYDDIVYKKRGQEKFLKEENIGEEKEEMSLRNVGLAELEEMGYESGEKAAYTHATVVTRLQNSPDKSAYNKGLGYYIVLSHGIGYETMYAHLSKRLVKKGDRVKRGQTIGLVGNTGRSTGSHLHYEVRRYGKAINPMKYLQVADITVIASK